MKEIERAREIGMKLMEELAKKAEECSTPSELATIIHAYMELIRVSGVRISDGSPSEKPPKVPKNKDFRGFLQSMQSSLS